ncbi:MAG: glycosyltransferase family 2 protein [Candidatus Zixiibacteriota bacterium]|nr:MAG: glycosyltransferase family 2 protein [candidate division Zixibacteria bacterium]
MNPVSVVIIARNEKRNIERCLRSVSWADEIIVMDSQSHDGTADLARQHGAGVYDYVWSGYGAAKRAAVEKASHDWILSIDADEEITPPLRQEIQAVLSGHAGHNGYYLPRRTLFLGRWIRHCGWYPDHVLRLFRKSRGNFDDAVVHERVVIDGAAGYLKNDMLHYSYPTLEEYFRKFDWYTTLGAREAARRGLRAGWLDIAGKPPLSFVSHYLIRQGFRDGLEGFLVSALSALAVMVKYAKVREIQRTGEVLEKEYVETTGSR